LDGQGIQSAKKPPVYAALDKRDKIGPDEFRKLLEKEGLTVADVEALEKFFHCKNLADLRVYFPESTLSDGPGPQAPSGGLWELEKLFAYMDSLGYAEYLNLDLSVVRGLAYYTGIVFEVYDKAKSLRAIAGGGRYDNLLASLGGLSLTGVGFGMGDVVLGDLLREKGLLKGGREPLDYFLLDVDPSPDKLPKPELLRLAMLLRAKGRRVGYGLSGEKFKKQMSQANDQAARCVLFFGSDKALPGTYEIKDMHSGEQKTVEIDAL
jgi:histidyl-tRNA synthetase